MFNKFLMATAIAGGMIAASSASAASITFDRTEATTTGSLTFSNGTTSVDLSGKTLGVDGSITGDASINSYVTSGVGVCSTVCDWRQTSADRQVDGANVNEGVLLDFGSTLVRLTSVVMTYADDNDLFSVFNMGNGADAAPTAATTDNAVPDSWMASIGIPDIGVGSLFNIASMDSDSEFKIIAVRFDVVPAQTRLSDQPAPVPLPAGGLLLLGGLGGLAALRRRKKS